MDQQHQRARTARNTSNDPDPRYSQSSQQQVVVNPPPQNQQPYLQSSTTSDRNCASLRSQPPTIPPVPTSQTNFSQAGFSGTQPQPVVTVGSTAPPFNSPTQFQAPHTISGFSNPGASTSSGIQRHFPSPPASADNHSLNVHQAQCKLPGCREPRFFDNRVQELLDYCRYHVYTVIPEGFAALCERCKELPARQDSKYCSRACSNSADARGQSVVRQPSVGAVPQGFAATCQECRRPMGDSNRRFCSLQCENANRGHLSRR